MTAQQKVEASLASAMAAAFAKIEAATKSANNPHFKSKYADLGAVIDAVKPPLIEHGLFFTQRCHPCDNGVSVETVLHHAGGQEMSLGTLFVPANKNDAQGFGSALTYARRYGLMTAFGVPAEDDDGNAAVKAAPNPSTGELPPKKRNPGENFDAREVLEGPYSSGSALRGAIKAFASQLAQMSDMAEFTAWMESPDVVGLEKQALRYLPGWWDTGEGCAKDFEPMTSRIHRKRKELEEIESIHETSGAKFINAG